MDRAALEADVRTRAESGDFTGAAGALVKGYGPEIVTYLSGVLRTSDDNLREAFAVFCEDVCRGIRSFRFESSVRTWTYVIANRAALKHMRSARQHARRFDGPADVEKIAAMVHTTTVEYMRTTNHDKLAEAREKLDPEERTILILRVDRQLPWREIALVMSEDGLTGEALRLREQALRKKFETVKRHVREHLGK